MTPLQAAEQLRQGFDDEELNEMPMVVILPDGSRAAVVDARVEAMIHGDGHRILIQVATLEQLGIDVQHHS